MWESATEAFVLTDALPMQACRTAVDLSGSFCAAVLLPGDYTQPISIGSPETLLKLDLVQ
ncbi:hypothetical protein BN2475_90077 [Paraburkholderia ribeironis]|uniref:Uncharacterized protein n=1 Tax=Paraburkholderia ribeironis TaxID=1247936 RepID=A0A1N7RN70_9BURK|nr:hypothetical protein [Paraburkholderia ribeironis]SIT36545.1 hypothetical protein BN2475_90077 [Paraburkholderia ribeironis]